MKTHKVFAMDETKRKMLFDSAMDEFSRNGYKKASTDIIVKKAKISKGLLFHYFGTKKDLFLFLFLYANEIIMNEYYEKIDYLTGDIFIRLRSMLMLKIELTQRFPAVFDFVSCAYFEKDPNVSDEISHETKQMYLEASGKLLENLDMALFKNGIDPHKALDIILFTFKGYSNAQVSPDKKMEDYQSESKRYIQELDEYIAVLRAAFYREGLA